MEITRHTTILALLEAYPEARDVLAALGMGCLDCLGASLETLATGTRMHGLEVEAVLAALNRAIDARGQDGDPKQGLQQE